LPCCAGTKREEVERGQVLCKPGSSQAATPSQGEPTSSTKEEGGRPYAVFTTIARNSISDTDVTGWCICRRAPKWSSGDNIAMTIELIVPIAMEEKLRFAIREGGRTVGSGVVTSIIE